MGWVDGAGVAGCAAGGGVSPADGLRRCLAHDHDYRDGARCVRCLTPRADGLTGAQADGLACVVCGADYLLPGSAAHVPVGWSGTGSQVFACVSHGGGAE